MRIKRFIVASMPIVVALGMTLWAGGCQTAPPTESKRESLVEEAQAALKQMKAADPSLQEFLDKAHAYAIFPSVGKGGLIAGGAYGRGVVYQNGQFIGYADITQATVGAQIGGQAFRELVVFQNTESLERFKTGKLAFSANASAVALDKGVAKAARYTDGVAVFVQPLGGLMAEASIGGQQFTFQAK
ncbi:hypothetical protein [Fontivita pretiosa]|uniref:lipid-binding SYLF domain-containing protein n=1 Tax=Fontivita pretiosa TaxID=2989684 RepID=UPI003D185350